MSELDLLKSLFADMVEFVHHNLTGHWIVNIILFIYPLAELNKRIFKSANRFVVNVVYILKDCKCTYFP